MNPTPLPSKSPPRRSSPAPAPAPAPSALFGTNTTASAAAALPVLEDGLSDPALLTEEKRRLLDELDRGQVKGCVRCRLSQTRTNTVFGEGDVDAELMFVGEGPGETEDNTGRPFVGRAGELLTKQIAAMGLRREQVFIANVVKCRPPDNREPAPDEVATCTPYLVRQLEIIRPKVIVTLGLPASRYLLQTKLSMGKMRGHWHAWRGIPLMPIYHPAYILRNYTLETRKTVWDDLQLVMSALKLRVPRGPSA